MKQLLKSVLNVFIVVTLCALSAACVLLPPTDDWAAQRALDERFVYVEEAPDKDDWKFLEPEGKVYGDCEDYAITLQREIGGKIWLLYPMNGGVGHAVVVKGGLVYDNLIFPHAPNYPAGTGILIVDGDFAKVRAGSDNLN